MAGLAHGSASGSSRESLCARRTLDGVITRGFSKDGLLVAGLGLASGRVSDTLIERSCFRYGIDTWGRSRL